MIYDWIAMIVLAIFMAVLINRFLFCITVVSSFSMYPTLKPGDKLLTKRICRHEGIRRGDILVFYNDEFHEMMIKRVIGLPGDEVQLNSGMMRINQTLYKETYVECPGQYSGGFHVPPGHYLFLGDNRTDSVDSRNWKHSFIAQRNIRGKVILSIFPYRRLVG